MTDVRCAVRIGFTLDDKNHVGSLWADEITYYQTDNSRLSSVSAKMGQVAKKAQQTLNALVSPISP
jgi:hypothetical protein